MPHSLNRDSWPASQCETMPLSTSQSLADTAAIDERNRVTVCVRIKPFIPGYSSRHEGKDRKESEHQGKCLRWSNKNPKRISMGNPKQQTTSFKFDKVFSEESTQADIYQHAVKPLVASFLDGHNVCCLAYGQSKSGKSYTTIGKIPASSRRRSSCLDSDSSCVSSLSSCGASELRAKNETSFADNQNLGVPIHLGIATDSPRRQKSQKHRVHLPGIHEQEEEENLPTFAVNEAGIIPRLVHDVASQVESSISGSKQVVSKLYCSYVEIHYDKVVDLLAGSASASNNVKLQSTADGKFSLEGATEELIPNSSIIVELLQRDTAERKAVGNSASTSSLHHTIFVLKLEKKIFLTQETTKNFFCVVDLAKSDVMSILLSDNDDEGGGTQFPIKQETFVFRTLTTLGNTLSHVEPIATQLDGASQMIELALGQVSKISIILNISQSFFDAKHTYQTLLFGQSILPHAEGAEASNESASEHINEAEKKQYSGNSMQTETFEVEKPTNLVEKMQEMELQLQQFRIGADERSRVSEQEWKRSFKAGGSGNNLKSTTRLDESLRATLKNSNRKDGKKEDELAEASGELKRVSALLHATAIRMGSESSSVLPSDQVGKNTTEYERQSDFVTLDRLRHKLRKRERTLKEKDAIILQMRKDNLALEKSKRKRQLLLDKAKSEMKLLLNRVIEAEAHLSDVKDSCKATVSQEVAKLAKELKDCSRTTEGSVLTNVPTEDRTHLTSTTLGTVDASGFQEEAIRVCLRLRPLSKLEASRRSRCCIEVQEGCTDFTVDSPLDGEYDFHYDKVFDMDASQNEVYDFVSQAGVKDLLQGMNCCCAVYGLSGSGKSYTILGDFDGQNPIRTSLNVQKDEKLVITSQLDSTSIGIIPRIFHDLFIGIDRSSENTEFTVRCSFVAIYLERIFDLVEPQLEKTLQVNHNGCSVHIGGIGEAWCFRESDAMAVVKRGIVSLDVLSRRMDIDVQEMHTILIITLEQRDSVTGASRMSKYFLADMAWDSSKSSKPGSKRNNLQDHGQEIIPNLSLSSFTNMIKSLADGKKEVCYSESKVTSLLRDAFGGNCKTTVIITASPASYSISETIMAIRLGYRCRKILNTPKAQKFWSPFVARQGKAVKGAKTDTMQFDALESQKTEQDATDNFSEKAHKVAVLQDETESLSHSLQTDLLLLRRQNSSLTSDVNRKDLEIMDLRKQLKFLDLKISAVEKKSETSHSRECDALLFLRHLRKLCWRLQKDVTRDRSLEICAITSSLKGAPDLSGLVELDTLLLHAGLIDQREITDVDEDDEDSLDEYRSSRMISTVVNGTYVDFPHEDDAGTGTTVNIHDDASNQLPENGVAKPANQRRVGLKLRPQQLLSTMKSHLPFQSQNSQHGSVDSRRTFLSNEANEVRSRKFTPNNVHSMNREFQLEKQLRAMTQKCVELQVIVTEQKSTLHMLCNRSGNLDHKKLAHEVVSLKKERDEMEHNAKAALWKLQELHAVNKIMFKKAQETKTHVSSLEEGFHRLQDTFRETALESLDNEMKLREEISVLHSVINALTGAEAQRIGDLELPECRLNLTLRGAAERLLRESAAEAAEVAKIAECRQWLKLLKGSKRRVAASKCPVFKFHRRARKTGDSIGGARKSKMLMIKKLKSRLVIFEGRDLFYSVLDGM